MQETEYMTEELGSAHCSRGPAPVVRVLRLPDCSLLIRRHDHQEHLAQQQPMPPPLFSSMDDADLLSSISAVLSDLCDGSMDNGGAAFCQQLSQTMWWPLGMLFRASQPPGISIEQYVGRMMQVLLHVLQLAPIVFADRP